MWCPPSDVCWFIKPMNTIVISAINHSYGSCKPTYLTMGHHLAYMKHTPVIFPEKRLGSIANALHRIMPMCNVRMPERSGEFS